MPKRSEVYAVLDGERTYQGLTWGHTLGIPQFLLFTKDYLRKAVHAFRMNDATAVLHIIRKVTAMGVACMETNGAPPRPDPTAVPAVKWTRQAPVNRPHVHPASFTFYWIRHTEVTDDESHVVCLHGDGRLTFLNGHPVDTNLSYQYHGPISPPEG